MSLTAEGLFFLEVLLRLQHHGDGRGWKLGFGRLTLAQLSLDLVAHAKVTPRDSESDSGVGAQEGLQGRGANLRRVEIIGFLALSAWKLEGVDHVAERTRGRMERKIAFRAIEGYALGL